MQAVRCSVWLLVAVTLVAGCTSTQVSQRQAYEGGKLPKPGRILVYDFAATPADIPTWSNAHSAYAGAAAQTTPAELAAGRKLGADVASRLVERIGQMGLVAVRAQGQPGPAPDDIAITGYFASIDPGSRVERMVIGFGTGTAEVKTHVDGYRMTDGGMQRLGGADVASGGGAKGPGLIVPALVTVATANPIGLAVGGAVKAEGEISGRTTDEGSARRIADEIAQQLEIQFQKQGWI